MKKYNYVGWCMAGSLSKYEKGILPVSVETLEEFGDVFHIPTSHLLSCLLYTSRCV